MYEYAGVVEKVAKDLIDEYHTDLLNVRIEYVWSDKPTVRNGKVTLGKARKITGLAAFLATGESTQPFGEDEDQSFFVVEIDKTYWPTLTDEQQKALVDHELSHCFVDEDGKLSILPHDLEEFIAVIRRHGLWSESAQQLVSAARVKENQDINAELNAEMNEGLVD